MAPDWTSSDDAAIVLGGVDLDAHLRGRSGFFGSETNLAGFIDVVGQRLLTVDVLLVPEGTHGGHGMGVFAGGDDNGVEILRPIKDLSEVSELLCLGVGLGGLVDGRLVNVTKGDDVLRTDPLGIAAVRGRRRR